MLIDTHDENDPVRAAHVARTEAAAMLDVKRGRLAYDAYRESVDGHSPVTGDRLPDFEDCPETVRVGWVHAARAVTRDVLISTAP